MQVLLTPLTAWTTSKFHKFNSVVLQKRDVRVVSDPMCVPLSLVRVLLPGGRSLGGSCPCPLWRVPCCPRGAVRPPCSLSADGL